jgi:hypothetical protein
MQNLLEVAIETEGPGLLIHPTIGALRAGLVSSSTAVHRDKMRVIEVAFEFVEAGDSLFPLAIIATVVSVLAAADSAVTATNNDLASSAGPAATVGPAVTGEGANVVGAFAAQTTTGGANPTAIVGMAAALPPPDSNTSYGRYGAGSASALLADGTTVATLGAARQSARRAGAGGVRGRRGGRGIFPHHGDDGSACGAGRSDARGNHGPSQPGARAARPGRVQLSDDAGGSVGKPAPAYAAYAGGGAAMATMRNAMTAACRRAALISLAPPATVRPSAPVHSICYARVVPSFRIGCSLRWIWSAPCRSRQVR